MHGVGFEPTRISPEVYVYDTNNIIISFLETPRFTTLATMLYLRAVGFEPTRLSPSPLKGDSLDQLGASTCSCGFLHSYSYRGGFRPLFSPFEELESGPCGDRTHDFMVPVSNILITAMRTTTMLTDHTSPGPESNQRLGEFYS